MEIMHELMLDLQQTGTRQVMYAKRGDSLTRTAKIRLYDGGTEFSVPSGTILQIAYAKSDGKGGLYDTMPDNNQACTASGNVVTAKLHPQMFTVAGLVACELRLLTGNGEQLSTFLWYIAVQTSATDGIESEDYYNFATLNGIMEDVGDISDLTTSVKTNLVAAINSVNSSVEAISKRYIRGVNGKQRDASGNVTITAEDIDVQVQEIQYQGDVQRALNALASKPAIPVARGNSTDGTAYAATNAGSGAALPVVSVADNAEQISAVGKGRQIVFVPSRTSATIAPTLQLNGGEVIPIRVRAPKNQSSDVQSPDATLPVPVGALMRGVPYTMTFCGKYWLVDSQITQLDQSAADTLTKYADRLTALTDSDTIAAPIINSMDGINGNMATMYVQRSAQEYAEPPADGNATVPTVERVAEMLRTYSVTEKLTIVPSASYPNITTFEYTESAAPEQYVIAKAGKLQGGLLRVDFNPNDIVNFDLNLYVFDSLGRPYKQTNFSERIAESGGFRGDDYSPTWKDPGVGEGFGEVVSPFSVQIPDGCAVMVCMRRGWEHVTSPNGTITTNAQFAQWAVNGGIKITVTVPTITVDTKLSEASGNAIANSSVTAAVNLLHMTSNVKAIAHRGLAGSAPENTLSAYKIARKKGFEYAECDVSFTADGAAVLLHDDTVDRTSDGTGSIGAMTFAQARTLDFGSWYDEKFAGERIPLFSEFISLCRAIGLHPYIELKPTGATQERVASLVATVKRYGMARRVTWISFYSNLLEFVKLADPSARLGFVTEASTEEAITAAVSTIQAMQTDTNEVFCDTDINSAGMVSAMRNADIPLEFWTANTEAVLKTLDPYFSGVTSDCLHFGRFLYETNGATA